MGQVWIGIVIVFVFVLLIIGGLFTSTELALVSLRAGQLQAISPRVDVAGHRLTVTAVQGWRAQRLLVTKPD